MLPSRWLGVAVIGTMIATAAGAVADSSFGRGPDASESPYRHSASWSMDTDRFGNLMMPLDVGVDDSGRAYVADAASNQVLIVDPSGVVVSEWRAEYRDRCHGMMVPQALDVVPELNRVYILWHFYRPDASSPTAAMIQTRDLSGRLLETEPVSNFALDVAVDVATSTIWLLYGGAFEAMGKDELLVVAGNRPAAGSLAVLPNGWLVSVKRDGRVAVDTSDGVALGKLNTRDYVAVAVDTDGEGRIHVLVRPVSNDPSAPIVLVFDEVRGDMVSQHEPSDLGVVDLPTTDWPFSISVSGEQTAVTSAGESFLVGRLGMPAVVGAPARASFDTPEESGYIVCDPPPLVIANVFDSTIRAIEGENGRIVSFDHQGTPSIHGELGVKAVDAAIVANDVYLITSSGRVERRHLDNLEEPVWSVDCSCLPGGRLAANSQQIAVIQPAVSTVAILAATTGVLEASFVNRQPMGEWPFDVAWDGAEILVADLYDHEIERWSPQGDFLSSYSSGFVTGPSRVGIVGSGPETILVAGMLNDYVEISHPASGALIAGWSPDVAGQRQSISDIAIADDGRVYVADAAHRLIHVFDPVTELPPPDPRAPTAEPSDYSCLVEGTKIASPQRVPLGSVVQVTLTLRATCPRMTRDTGADIVLVVDHSRSSSLGEPWRVVASGLVRVIDTSRHRIGVISLGQGDVSEEPAPEVVIPLTSDREALLTAIEALPNDSGSFVAPGLRMAADHLLSEGREGALPVVVLISDGGHDHGGTPGVIAGAELRAQGIQTYAIGVYDDALHEILTSIAGSRERYFYAPTEDDLFQMYMQVMHWVTTSSPGDWLIHDAMSADVQYMPESSRPPAVELEGGRHLMWSWSILSSEGVTLTYAITPTTIGRISTNESAVADFTDIDGAPRSFVFPVPEIDVLAPTATPTATNTPQPTSTPPPSPIYLPLNITNKNPTPKTVFLPIALQKHCEPTTSAIDVALVIDASTSMLDLSDGGESKMALAVQAARHFISLLGETEQTAIVSFNGRATMEAQLTTDRRALDAALAGIENDHFTRIDLGVRMAREELLGPRRLPVNDPVMIVLTDGRANPVGPEAVLAEGDITKAEGITIFAIGLGSVGDLDDWALRRLATRPDYYYETPSAGELADIYERIAGVVSCSR